MIADTIWRFCLRAIEPGRAPRWLPWVTKSTLTIDKQMALCNLKQSPDERVASCAPLTGQP